MTEVALGAAEGLARVHAQAQTEALRLFGDGPAPSWQPQRPARSVASRTLLVIVAGAALAATTWALGPIASSADAAAVAIPTRSAPVVGSQDDAVVDAEPVTILRAPPSGLPARQDQVPATLVVEHAGVTWRIDAAHASRLDAARRLAQLSGSPLLGATELIAGTRPLDLRWQGRDLAGAWKAVLGPDLNYALQCRHDRCRAWIVAAAEPGANLDLPSAPPASVAQAVDVGPLSDAGDPQDRLHHD